MASHGCLVFLGKSLQTSLGRGTASVACVRIKENLSLQGIKAKPVQSPAHEEVLLSKESRWSQLCQAFDHMVRFHLMRIIKQTTNKQKTEESNSLSVQPVNMKSWPYRILQRFMRAGNGLPGRVTVAVVIAAA